MTKKVFRVPQGANLDMGLTALRFAGLEETDGLSGSVVSVAGANGDSQWFFLTATQVKESMRNLNAAVVALDGDVRANVSRQAFLDAWNVWKGAWDAFQKQNDTDIKIWLHGTGAVWRQIEEYRKQLEGWRLAYQKETGNLAPSGPMPAPTPPGQKKEPESFWTPTKIAVGLGLAALIGYVGYKYYVTMSEEAKEAKKFVRGAAMGYLTRGAGGGNQEGA